MADIETVPFGRQVERGGKKSSLFRSRRYYTPPIFSFSARGKTSNASLLLPNT